MTEILNNPQTEQCNLHIVSTRLFECIYYNHTGRVQQRCEIKARNIEEATTHFKFFYPKKLLWKINAL